MKTILLIGDSIRIGYQEYVKEAIKDKGKVVYPEENGRFSKYTLWAINLWIAELGKPDIVHFNTGLWDLHHEYPMVEALSTKEEYIENLRRIINELERTGAKLIFATTTPIANDGFGRSNFEIDEYNKAALKLMTEKGIEVNDLNSLVKDNLNEFMSSDKLHLNEEGYKKCGEKVTGKIIQYL
jgi:lysophospholipase L1-like esterase